MANDDIQGTVTDANGNAVGGAIVALWDQDNPNIVKTTTADSNGNYMFEGHPDGNGTSVNWHVAARDPNDVSRQFPSLHSIDAQLIPEQPSAGVARYTLDNGDISGSTIIDVWNANNISSQFGIATGDSGLATTYDSGESINLDGTDDYLESSVGLLNNLSSWSVSLWADYTGTSKGWRISERNDLNNFGILNNTPSDELIIFYNSTQIRSSGKLGPVEHITVTFDGSTLTVYRNGSPAGNNSVSGTMTSSGFYYGVRSGLVEYHEGGLDDIRLYDRALSATEVSDLYNTGTIL